MTIEEAATRLGKTERQIRYLLKAKGIRAEKRAGRWFVAVNEQDKNDAAQGRKKRALLDQAQGVIDPDGEASSKRRYSMRDLKAFELAVPLYRLPATKLGSEDRITTSLRHVLELLALGCHRFDPQEKAEAYRQARDEASKAACEATLHENPAATGIVETIEQDLMAGFAGLLRRIERRRRFQ